MSTLLIIPPAPFLIDVDYTKTPHYYKGIPGNYTSYVYTDYIQAHEMTQLKNTLSIRGI